MQPSKITDATISTLAHQEAEKPKPFDESQVPKDRLPIEPHPLHWGANEAPRHPNEAPGDPIDQSARNPTGSLAPFAPSMHPTPDPNTPEEEQDPLAMSLRVRYTFDFSSFRPDLFFFLASCARDRPILDAAELFSVFRPRNVKFLWGRIVF
jgi:hypothetical protein